MIPMPRNRLGIPCSSRQETPVVSPDAGVSRRLGGLLVQSRVGVRSWYMRDSGVCTRFRHIIFAETYIQDMQRTFRQACDLVPTNELHNRLFSHRLNAVTDDSLLEFVTKSCEGCWKV